MKILLLEPPAVSKFGNQRIFGGNGGNKSDFRKPPLDLMMISGYLKKNGFDNELIDANTSRRNLRDLKKILAAKPVDVVFFSTSTCTIYKDLDIARLVKGLNPQAKTVAVGTHIMALPAETLALAPELDAAITTGEWEAAALSIVQHLPVFNEARGIMFRNQKGEFITTQEPRPIIGLDELGFPSHDKLEKGLYRDPTSKTGFKTMVMGQKACINNCIFCCQPAFFGAPRLRQRSVAHLLNELKWVKELGFGEVMFNDATLTADKVWATELFKGMIERKLGLSWNCSTRADCLDPDILDLMKKAGCHTIALGMESTDAAILKNIRKNITSDDIKIAASQIKAAGIDSIVFSVVGFPGETRQTIEKTITFLTLLNTSFITLGIAVPVPGTEFYRYVKENGYLLTDDWSLYDPLKKPVFSYTDLSSEEMAAYSKYGLRRFYLRPGYIWARLRSVTSFRQLCLYGRNFFGFLERYVLPRKTI